MVALDHREWQLTRGAAGCERVKPHTDALTNGANGDSAEFVRIAFKPVERGDEQLFGAGNIAAPKVMESCRNLNQRLQECLLGLR